MPRLIPQGRENDTSFKDWMAALGLERSMRICLAKTYSCPNRGYQMICEKSNSHSLLKTRDSQSILPCVLKELTSAINVNMITICKATTHRVDFKNINPQMHQ